MNTDITFLPDTKQRELRTITQLIKSHELPEMIILFGSYARNEWVEEKYDDEHYRYQSDYDIAVIVDTRSESKQARLEGEFEKIIDQEDSITTPVSLIVHDIAFVNRRLAKAQYFFSDIKNEGILLYDSGKNRLREPKVLSNQERARLAQEDLDYYFNKAEKFITLFNFSLSENYYNESAFLLHQATECLYTAILLVFTRYKPNTHDLAILRKLANSIHSQELAKIFPQNTSKDRRLFKLLRKAYVDARYKPSYQITEDDLRILIARVDALKNVGGTLCREKINCWTLKTNPPNSPER